MNLIQEAKKYLTEYHIDLSKYRAEVIHDDGVTATICFTSNETSIDDVFSKEEQALIFQALDGPLQSESDDVRCLAESITQKLKLPGKPLLPHR